MNKSRWRGILTLTTTATLTATVVSAGQPAPNDPVDDSKAVTSTLQGIPTWLESRLDQISTTVAAKQEAPKAMTVVIMAGKGIDLSSEEMVQCTERLTRKVRTVVDGAFQGRFPLPGGAYRMAFEVLPSVNRSLARQFYDESSYKAAENKGNVDAFFFMDRTGDGTLALELVFAVPGIDPFKVSLSSGGTQDTRIPFKDFCVNPPQVSIADLPMHADVDLVVVREREGETLKLPDSNGLQGLKDQDTLTFTVTPSIDGVAYLAQRRGAGLAGDPVQVEVAKGTPADLNLTLSLSDTEAAQVILYMTPSPAPWPADEVYSCVRYGRHVGAPAPPDLFNPRADYLSLKTDRLRASERLCGVYDLPRLDTSP